MKHMNWLLILMCSISPFAVSAGTHHYCSDYAEASNEEESLALSDLRPWTRQLQEKVTQQKSYLAIKDKMLQRFSDSQNIICAFSVDESGNLLNPRDSESSGSDEIDSQILNLVKTAAPFSFAPNNMPCHRGLKIEFCKFNIDGKEEIKFWTIIDPSTRNKPYKLVHYPKSEFLHK